MPFQFVLHRWVENVPFIAKHVGIFTSITAVRASRWWRKTLKKPDTESYKHVTDGCTDPLLEVKLHFTLSLAKILQTFILLFQTDSDKPISFLFLVSDEVNLVQDLLARFIDIW